MEEASRFLVHFFSPGSMSTTRRSNQFYALKLQCFRLPIMCRYIQFTYIFLLHFVPKGEHRRHRRTRTNKRLLKAVVHLFTCCVMFCSRSNSNTRGYDNRILVVAALSDPFRLRFIAIKLESHFKMPSTINARY